VRAAVVAVLVAASLGGCFGCGSGGGPRPGGAGARIGPPIELADCTDWRQAGIGERWDTVREIRRFAGGPVGSPGLHGAVLDDDKAYDLFDHWCANDFARRFKLYKLYTRAASFGAR
jgi:hypothetical protein